MSYIKFLNHKEQKDIEILEDFLKTEYGPDRDDKKYYDITFRIMTDFSIDMLDDLISAYFNEPQICYTMYLHIELVKYIYAIWNDESHKLYHWVTAIKTHLVKTANLSRDELYDVMQRRERGSSALFYTWWLYVYYPLVPDAENLMLKLTKIARFNDAQDMFMYGIYQMEPKRLYHFMKNWLPSLYEIEPLLMCFDPLCSSTGALDQLKMIADKLNAAGMRLFDEPYIIDITKEDADYLNGVTLMV
ncbi:MAG: putative orfan [Hyperionvirus sp.]|uniref:Putative orfan n=1 Tax=Hyperionvirus sp. TaxID=2487770 RepID=A0A3G5ABF9_9VIRU|nr:MAG: putative orfan [Hyperionvirus sp.]